MYPLISREVSIDWADIPPQMSSRGAGSLLEQEGALDLKGC